MIRALFLNKGENVCGFKISGHAGYADAGSDIVCASVSSAVQMSANTVTEILKVKASVSDKSGTIELELKNAEDEKFQEAVDILKGLRLHLTILSQQFQGTISIEDSEV